MTESGRTVDFGERSVELSNLEKPFFPGADLTRGDVVSYYGEVADTLLPHVEDRPLTMQRFPDGLAGDGFYERDRPDHFPDWIESVKLEKEQGEGEVDCVLGQDRASLPYLADQAVLTFHAWPSRRDRPRRPDRMTFDLDLPGEPSTAGDGGGFRAVKAAARSLRDVLEETGLEPFVMTTGSRGLHLRVPLERRQSFDEVRKFARSASELVARQQPASRPSRGRPSGRDASTSIAG